MLRILLILFALFISVHQASAISLKSAAQRALDNHPQVAAAIARFEANRARLEQSNANLAPTFDLNADIGKQFIKKPGSLTAANDERWWLRRQATVALSYVLFDGWQRANSIYRDAARLDAASLNIIENAEVLVLNVVEAYIDHRRHRFLLSIADGNIRNHNDILGLTRTRLEGGKGTESEVDQVLERLYAAKAVRAEVLEAALQADAKFNAAVGVKPTKTSPVAYPASLPKSVESAIAIARNNNSGISARMAEADSLAFEQQRREGTLFPTLKFDSSAQFGQDLNAVPGVNNDYTVKLSLNWRLYDGGLREAQIRESAELKSEALLNRDLKIRNVQEAIESAWGKLTATRIRQDAIQQQVAASRRVVRAYREEFEASKRSLLDLLDSQSAVFSSRFESASVAGVRLFTAYSLQALTGTLLQSLGVSSTGVVETDFRSRIGSSEPAFNFTIEPLR